MGRSTRAADRFSDMPFENRLEPIQVTISEAWSWNQQGIIKSAGMVAAEVEPHSLQQAIKFEDVQGVDEAKHELEDIVSFLKEPKKYADIGGKLPKGILLYGPPGTGKTHLARAVAGEAGVPFFQMSGSEFDELYVGVGARRVRELFNAAKAKAPCIVFIDEIDAVGSKRSSRDQSYMRQTLNQLLVELDGFSPNEGVIFIAATNTPEALDKALVRPGRFDRHVAVPLPDVQGRSKILEVHMKGVTVTPEVEVNTIARGTPGFSGADLANLINQAAIKASKDNAPGVRNSDLEWAKDRIIMGAERKSAVITEHAKKLTAYHEGGHTLVALYTPNADKLHKVTVIPRGQALGVTVQLPEGDKSTHTKRELNAMIDVALGGRAAEELIFGAEEVTTGASSDLEKASSLAREMVITYGMSDKMGLVALRSEELENAAPNTKLLVDNEIKLLLENGYSRASAILKVHKEELHRLANALVEYETLTLEEVKWVIKVQTSADTLNAKIASLEAMTLNNPASPITLDTRSFKLLTEKPRNYSSFIVLTAMGREYNCEPCREFASEFGLVTQGWAKTREAGRSYFGTLDFKDGQEVFRLLQIQSVPYVLHYPPSEGPHYKVIAKDFELYDLNRRGLKAEDLAQWIENVSRVQIKVSRPVDYSVYLVYAAGTISTLIILSLISSSLIEILQHKRLWISISLGCILLFCSGFMWNQIRGAPYTGVRDGKQQLIAGGFQSQYVIESQIAGVLYALCALFIVVLVSMVPQISDSGFRKVSVYFGVIGFLLTYSVILRMFKIKNGGYPFTLML
ncbi:hypothetical protein HDU67_001260 [Dinochytrium kinnereticum]|nr:hypothetical protein HDU67_001260 [Dinochytrium kinnereticum]